MCKRRVAVSVRSKLAAGEWEVAISAGDRNRKWKQIKRDADALWAAPAGRELLRLLLLQLLVLRLRLLLRLLLLLL